MPPLRALRPLPAEPGLLLEALGAALDGTGPAVLPLPTDPARVLAALRPDEPLESADIVLVVPTSGSTGPPKGALLTAAALTASATATAARLGGPGQWLLAIPTTHIGGVQVLVRSLLADTRPVVVDEGPFTAASFVAASARLAGARRYVSLVPTQLKRLVGVPAAEEALRSFDAVLLGGAAAPAALLDAAAAAGARIVATYGMSETAGGCVYDGRPLDGVEVLIDDGLVHLAGPVLCSGYRLRPDLTAQAFTAGTFRTSDLGELLPDGTLRVLGRADDVIVSGGEKVPPAAVEEALLRHPSVVEVAVAGTPDGEWGERVVAFVVLRAPLTLAEARDHVAGLLPRSWAPRGLRDVPQLPLLDSGKINRAGLRW